MHALRRLAAIATLLLFFHTDLLAQTGSPQPRLSTENLKIITASGAHDFIVEIARTETQREIGLMFRTALAANEAMLFLEGDGGTPRALSMWMKNTPLSLDMIFIEGDGRIASLAEKTKPYALDVLSSGVPVVAVLEVKAGTAEKLGLKIGDRIESRSLCRFSACALKN